MNTPRERDHALDQWLQRTRLEPDAVTDECLDAETAAVWADGSLAGQQLEEAQLHMADCARCQTVMATLLASTPVRSGADPQSDASAWRRWLTWAVPIAATATALIAVAVWLNVPVPTDRVAPTTASPFNGASPGPASGASAGAGSQPFSPVEQKETAPPPAPPDRRPTALSADNTSNVGPGQERADGSRPLAAAKQAPGEAVNPDAALKDNALDNLKVSDANARDATAAATAAPTSQAAAAAPPVSPPAAPPSPASTAPSDPQRARAAQQNVLKAGSTLRESVQTATVVSSPSAAIRWRTTGVVVERTTDGGVTWTPSPTGMTARFSAGSAPSPQVCWLVGTGGGVALTTDGTRWTQVPFPEAIDLSGVSAVDDRSAAITAADGRVFTTSDGGRTWSRSR